VLWNAARGVAEETPFERLLEMVDDSVDPPANALP
jgi:hypothetical protein